MTFSVKKCGVARCKTCSILIEMYHKYEINGKTVIFNSDMNCNSVNIVYILLCNTCSKCYVGETNSHLRLRMSLHRQHINNPQYSFLNVSAHIRSCGCKYSVIPIYHISNESTYILRKTEDYFIHYLQPELNR